MAVAGERREEALFGLYDGVVSVVGFVFALLIHHSPGAAIAVGGLGGAVSATVSMGTGELEKSESPLRDRLPVALAMAVATLVGSLAPVWPFFAFSRSVAVGVSAASGVAVALVIAHVKSSSPACRHSGWRSYVTVLGILGAAVGLTLLVVSWVPQSA